MQNPELWELLEADCGDETVAVVANELVRRARKRRRSRSDALISRFENSGNSIKGAEEVCAFHFGQGFWSLREEVN
jgi:hypothetical protein